MSMSMYVCITLLVEQKERGKRPQSLGATCQVSNGDFERSISSLCIPSCDLGMRLRTVLVAAIGALLPFVASAESEQQTYKYEVSFLLRTLPHLLTL